MNLEFLTEYFVVIVVGVCLCVGYILKHFTGLNCKYIPLIMGVLGVVINTWINMSFTPEILLGGLFSGLASTGLHQLFKQLINDENV